MITITKDDTTKVVTKGAFENFYKGMGFTEVKPISVKEAKVVKSNTNKNSNNEDKTQE